MLIVNPFLNRITNFIYIQPVDSIVNGLPVFNYKQVDEVLFYGSDIGIHYHPHFAHNLHFESTFSWVQTQTATDSSISLIPPARFTNSIRYDFNIGKKLQFKDVMVQHTFMNAQNKVAFNETRSQSYQLVDASLRFIWNIKTPLHLQIGCKNILNSNYIDHLSRLKNIEMPSPGRNFYLSLNFFINQNLKTK